MPPPTAYAALAAVAVLLLGALGLPFVRTIPRAARLLGYLVLVAFCVVASLSERAGVVELAPRCRVVQWSADDVVGRTQVLQAAGRAGPRAVELELRYRPPVDGARRGGEVAHPAALGASILAPPPLALAPSDIRLSAPGELRAARPALFEVELARSAVPVDALPDRGELVVRAPDGEDVWRESVELRERAGAASFTPAVAGRYQLEFHCEVSGHRLVASGDFDVAEPAEVLVVEPSGVVAAALTAQGETVRAVERWPADWRRHDRIVLGVALSAAEQQQLVAAVLDGLGLFVVGDGLVGEGEPLYDVLPVRPLPVSVDPAAGRGGAGEPAAEEPPSNVSPPEVSPEATPPEAKPPSEPSAEPPGDTTTAGEVGDEPIEVDKHTIAMVLVVDRSGSMAAPLPNGMTKMQYARSSARNTATALGEGDRVGVVSFGDERAARVELPMTEATDRDAIGEHLARLRGRNESTWLLDGLRAAGDLLAAEPAAVKHIVVISDGEFFDEAVSLRSVARQLRQSGRVTVSIVSIVDEGTEARFKRDALAVAEAGGGRFVAASDPRAVPVIVSAEVARALSRVGREPRRLDAAGDEVGGPAPLPGDAPPSDVPEPPADEPPQPQPDIPAVPEPVVFPVFAVVESALLEPAPDEWPVLHRASPTDAPFDAQVLLAVGSRGWPLLGLVNRGLGRVGALAVAPGAAAMASFRAAPAFTGWLGQWCAAVRVLTPVAAAQELRERVTIEPVATLPAEREWLTALAGAPIARLDEEPEPPASVLRAVRRDPVAAAAQWLLPLLALLAIGERIAIARALAGGGRSSRAP